jgi:hypothetical protein
MDTNAAKMFPGCLFINDNTRRKLVFDLSLLPFSGARHLQKEFRHEIVRACVLTLPATADCTGTRRAAASSEGIH